MIGESASSRPAVLVAFDLLQPGKKPLRALPQFELRVRLHHHIEPVPVIKIIEHIETHSEPLFHAIVDGDHECIVAKRMDAPYRAGPHDAGLKIKNSRYSRRSGWSGDAESRRSRNTGAGELSS